MIEVKKVNMRAADIINLEEQKQYEIAHVIENATSMKADSIIELIQEIEERYAY